MSSNQSYTFVCSLVNKKKFESSDHPHNLHELIPEALELEKSIFLQPIHCEWGKKHWDFEVVEVPDNINQLQMEMSSNQFTFDVGGVEMCGNLYRPGEAVEDIEPVLMRVLNLTNRDELPNLVELLNIEHDELDVGIYQSEFVFDPSGSFVTQTDPLDPDECLITCEKEMVEILEGLAVEFGGVDVRFKRATAVAEYRCNGPISGNVTADKIERSLSLKLSEATLKRYRMRFLRTESVDGAVRWLFSYFPGRLVKPLPPTLKFGNEIYNLVQEEASHPPLPPGPTPAQPTSAPSEATLPPSDSSSKSAESHSMPISSVANSGNHEQEINTLIEYLRDAETVREQIEQGNRFSILLLRKFNYHLLCECMKLELISKNVPIAPKLNVTLENAESIQKMLQYIRSSCIAREALSTSFQEAFNDLCKEWSSFEETEASIAAFRRMFPTTVVPSADVEAKYRNLSEKCKRCIDFQQKVDFLKLIDLIDDVNSGIYDLAGKDVLVFIGNSGVGKTTLTCKLFRARFEMLDPKGDHLVPVFDDKNIEAMMTSFRTGKSVHSITSKVHAIQIPPEWCGGRVIYILDTPGLDDTRSCEIAIKNSINMVRVLSNCHSVRPVIVLSKADLGNRLMTDGVKKTFFSIKDVLRNDKDIEKFTYVFTKYQEGGSICGDFEDGMKLLQGGDLKLLPLWKDVATKTKQHTIIVNKDTPPGPLLDDILRDDTAEFLNPGEVLSSCVASYAREAMEGQLSLYRESIRNLLARKRDHYPEFIRYQMHQLKKVALAYKELRDIQKCYEDCLLMIKNAVASAGATLEPLDVQLLFGASHMNDMCDSLITIQQLQPIMKELGVECSVDKSCGLFVKYFHRLLGYFQPSDHNHDMLLHAKDAICQVKKLLRDLMLHSSNFHPVHSIEHLRMSSSSRRRSRDNHLLCIWDLDSPDSIRSLRDLGRFFAESNDDDTPLSVWCVSSEEGSSFLMGSQGPVDADGRCGCAMVDAYEFRPISEGILVKEVKSLLSNYASEDQQSSFQTLEVSLDGVIFEAADLLIGMNDFLASVKLLMNEKMECANAALDFVSHAAVLDDAKMFSSSFRNSFKDMVNPKWHSESVERFRCSLFSVEDTIKNYLSRCLSEHGGIDNVHDLLKRLDVVIKKNAVPLIERQFEKPKEFTHLVNRISALIADYVESVAKKLLQYDHEALNEPAIRATARSECALLESMSRYPVSFQRMEANDVSTSQSMFDKARKHIASHFGNRGRDIRIAMHKLVDENPNCDQNRFGDTEGIIKLMAILCDRDTLYFDDNIYADAAEEAKRIVNYYDTICSSKKWENDILTLGKGLAAVECMVSVLKAAADLKDVTQKSSFFCDFLSSSHHVLGKIKDKLVSELKLLDEIERHYTTLDCNLDFLSRSIPRADPGFYARERKYCNFISDCRSIEWCLKNEERDVSIEERGKIKSIGSTVHLMYLNRVGIMTQLGEIVAKRENHLNAVWGTLTRNHICFGLDLEAPKKLLDQLMDMCPDVDRLNDATSYLCIALNYFKMYSTIDGSVVVEHCSKIEKMVAGLSEMLSELLEESTGRADPLSRIRNIACAFKPFDDFIPMVSFDALEKEAREKLTQMSNELDRCLLIYDSYGAVQLISCISTTDPQYEDKKEALRQMIVELIESHLQPERPLCSDIWRALAALNSAVIFTERIFQSGGSTRGLGRRKALAGANEFQQDIDKRMKCMLAELKAVDPKLLSMIQIADHLKALNQTMNNMSINWKTCGSDDRPVCFGCEQALDLDSMKSAGGASVEATCPHCHITQVVKSNKFADLYYDGLKNIVRKYIEAVDDKICNLKAALQRPTDGDVDFDFDSDDDDDGISGDDARSDASGIRSVDQSQWLANGLNELGKVSNLEIKSSNQEIVISFQNIWKGVSSEIIKRIGAMVDDMGGVKHVYGKKEGGLLKQQSETGVSLNDLNEKRKLLKNLTKHLSSSISKELFLDNKNRFVEYSKLICEANKEVKKLKDVNDMRTMLVLRRQLAPNKCGDIDVKLKSTSDEIMALLVNFSVNDKNSIMKVLEKLERNGEAMYEYRRSDFSNAVATVVDTIWESIVRPLKRPAVATNLLAIQACASVLDKFIRTEYVLKLVLHDVRNDHKDIGAVLDDCKSILIKAKQCCVEMCRDLDGALSKIELIIPNVGEDRLTSPEAPDLGLIKRTLALMEQLNGVKSLIDHFIAKEDSSDAGQEILRKHMDETDQRVFRLADERARLFTEKSLHNPKMQTPNISDKQSFLTLFQFCIQLSTTLASVDSSHLLERLLREFKAFSNICEQKLHEFATVSRNFKLSTGSSRVPVSVFKEFDLNQQVFEAAEDIFVEGLRDRLVEQRRYLVRKFQETVKQMVESAKMSEAEWAKWNDNYNIVAKVFVVLGAVASNVSIKEHPDLVMRECEELLQHYYIREGNTTEGREIGAQFIAALRRSIKSLDPDCELLRLTMFEQHANADRNAQFDKVPPSEIVSKMECSDMGEGFSSKKCLDLYNIFTNKFETIVDCCKDKENRHRRTEIPEMARSAARKLKTVTNGADATDKILDLMANAFAYWTLSEKSLECYDRTPAKEKTKKYLWLPNSVQVIAVIRLLGLDYPDDIISNDVTSSSNPKNPDSNSKSSTDQQSDKGGQTPALNKSKWGLSSIKAYASKKVGDVATAITGYFSEHKPSTPPPKWFANHLAQVLTGEGKSIVLAVLATVMALLNFDADVVCYSDELTVRDGGAFRFLFRDFGVLDGAAGAGTEFGVVRYATFKKICNDILNEQGDITERLEGLIENSPMSQVPVAKSPRKRHTVLLIDEVDVLFSEDFFGRSYDLLAQLKASSNPKIKNLFIHIWTNYKSCDRNNMLDVWNDVQASVPYRECVDSLGKWSFLVESSTKLMLSDLTNFDDTYKDKYVDIHPSKGIRYLDSDGRPVYNQRDSYRTLFELMRINEIDKARVSDELVERNMDILVKAGSFSYAEIPRLYDFILGVSGTLTLNEELAEYNFTRITKMPTSYPPYQPPSGSSGVSTSADFHGVFGEELVGPDHRNTHFDKILEEITKRRGEDRPILVFFKDDRVLNDFVKSPSFVATYNSVAQVIDASVDAATRERIIKKTAKAGSITLASAVYGRGTDFYYDDPRIDRLGGVHVIVTFFPAEESDLIQFFGRTRRQGHPGSRSLVLDEADFINFGVPEEEIYRIAPGDIAVWREMKRFRDMASADNFKSRRQAVVDIREEHLLSERAIKYLFELNTEELIKVLKEWNGVMVNFKGVASRTVIMVDATGSMRQLLNKVKLTIKEILRRIYEINGESISDGTSFAIQFVIYRNYNAAKVVEPSEWLSDGSLLNDFLDKVKIDGGCGREAIEMGLAHCNWEISEGRKPTQILLIGDYGPNHRDEVVYHRSRQSRNSLTGEEYYKTCGSYFVSPTYWEDELAKINTHNIPVHAYYLQQSNGAYPAKTDFEEINRRTVGGSCAELMVDGTNGGDNAELIGTLATKVLTDIQNNSGAHAGGQSLSEKYVQKYGAFRGYVRG